MNTSERHLVTDLRHALLRLHKTLLDWERASYERAHGRMSGNELLQAVLSDPQFAWLKPMSELIVHIDEALEKELPGTPDDFAVIVAEARALILPDPAAGRYAERYLAALQELPDAVLAHRDVAALVKRPDVVPAPRPH